MKKRWFYWIWWNALAFRMHLLSSTKSEPLLVGSPPPIRRLTEIERMHETEYALSTYYAWDILDNYELIRDIKWDICWNETFNRCIKCWHINEEPINYIFVKTIEQSWGWIARSSDISLRNSSFEVVTVQALKIYGLYSKN